MNRQSRPVVAACSHSYQRVLKNRVLTIVEVQIIELWTTFIVQLKRVTDLRWCELEVFVFLKLEIKSLQGMGKRVQ